MKTFAKVSSVIFFLLGVAAAAGHYLLHAPLPEQPPLGGSTQRGVLRVGGLDRTYLAYVPAVRPEHPALVIALHGSQSDGETMRVFTAYGFDRLADRYGFIVVYPDGFEGHWNDCRRAGPYAAKQLGIDDAGFVRSLIHHFRAEYDIDAARVFAAGFSNGGHMAYRLALEMPDAVRAIAAVGANLPAPDNLDCTPAEQPVAVMILNGTADPINPFEGGTVTLFGFGNRGRVLSAPASARYFSRLAGHDVRAAVTPPEGEGWDRVEVTTWSEPSRPQVSLVAVIGGGHTIPQDRFRFPRLLGRTSTDLDGPAMMWGFFARQTHASSRLDLADQSH